MRNYLKEWNYKPQQQKFPLLISLFVVTVLFLSTSSYAYDREAELMAQLYEAKGCAFSVNCPDSVKSEIVEEHNGLYPPQYYEKDTKEFWASYCTYMPFMCTK